MDTFDTNSIYMVSRYTNPNMKRRARHIETDGGPLCGEKLTKTGSWVRDSDEPDCVKCLKIKKARTSAMTIQYNQIYHMSANELLLQLGDDSIDMQFFDPPYGKNYKASTKKRYGKKQSRVTSEQTFDDTADTSFLIESYRVLKLGGACYLCTQWDTMHIWQSALITAGYNVNACIVWDKGLQGQGDLSVYGCQTEFILFATKGRHELRWQKRENNIWYIPRIDVINIDGNYDNPTQKPTTLIKHALQRSSSSGDLVLDCHIGTGTTMLASKQMGRKYIGCDISEYQISIANERLQKPVMKNMFVS